MAPSWCACLKGSSAQPIRSDEIPLHVDEEHSTKPPFKLPWLSGRKWLAILFLVLAAGAIGTGLGVGIGIGKPLNSRDPDTSAISAVETEDGAVPVNAAALASHLLAATAAAVTAVGSASTYVASEAVQDSASREAYLQARTAMAHVLPTLTVLPMNDNSSAAVYLMLLGQGDMQLVIRNDLTAIALQLQSLAAVSRAAAAAAGRLDPSTSGWPSTATVLKGIRGLYSPLNSRSSANSANSSSSNSESNEMVLLDVHQTLLATQEILTTALPSSDAMTGLRAIVGDAVAAAGAFARLVPDLWATRQPATAACTQQDGAKCANRRALYRGCGLKYESTLAQCRATLPFNGTRDVLVAKQWECRASAEVSRNTCLQSEEYVRACDEQVAKTFSECVGAAGSNAATCGARNATVRDACVAVEKPKRVGCQATLRITEVTKCSEADAAGMAACTAAKSSGGASAYTACVAANDAKTEQCKLTVETAVRSCEEQATCNSTALAAAATCQAAFVTAQQQANGNAAALAEATATRTTCEASVKAASDACEAGAAGAAKTWVDGQVASKAMVTTVRRYYTYLPYTLLSAAQRATVSGALSQLTVILRV